jgi:tRNA A-37 threonylcarbamoyl transferase component Bud32
MEQLVGKKLGNYEIIEMIGKGGMAAVYKGYQASMNRYVAIKVMSQQFSEQESFIQRFQNEAQLIAQLEHAHILPVYEFGKEANLLYIVMRYLPTGTLEDRIKESNLPFKEAIAIFTQIAGALNYAHSRGVIHRDLKPANILLDAQGNAFLSDFGIAKSIEGTQNLTGTGSVVGTPTYMSPEQGMGEAIDGRSDIYALGVMLFEMLTGSVPFKAENPMAVMLKHINEPPPQPRALNPAIHPDVEAVVLRALAKTREARYQTAQEMIDALNYAVSVMNGAMPSRLAGTAAQAADATLPSGFSAGAPTMPSPVAGTPQTATAIPGQPAGGPAMTAPGVMVAPPVPVISPLALMDDVKIDLNKVSAWIAKREWVGVWVQGLAVTIATFAILSRLTQGPLGVALLSLVPGLLLYALLRAPMVGVLTSMLLVLVPLLPHAPGLAVIWAVLMVVAGARLSSREIMVMLVTLAAATTPLGWLAPLLMPWWLRSRRVALPAALGVTFTMLFVFTLGWSNAGGLLPIQVLPGLDLTEAFNTSYLGLFESGERWAIWADPQGLGQAITSTFRILGEGFAVSRGIPLVIATGWAVASALTDSNRRSTSIWLRSLGIALSFASLLILHLALHPAEMDGLRPGTILATLITPLITFLFSQWPIQADPAAGSTTTTNLRILRQALGAFYMALGLSFYIGYVGEQELILTIPLIDLSINTYAILWIGGLVGTLTTIGNPGIGPLIMFAALAAGLSPLSLSLSVVSAVLGMAYLIIAFLFDRQRPRRWNPLGAGMIVGAPGMAASGILPLGPLSLGALEAQVPSALFGIAAHILLLISVRRGGALAFIAQVLITLAGVLLVERLMALKLLGGLNHRLRRLVFTCTLAPIMAVAYYTIGQAAPIRLLPNALILSVVSAGMLVAAMGNRAMFWRQFVERRETEEEEDTLEEDISGPGRKN